MLVPQVLIRDFGRVFKSVTYLGQSWDLSVGFQHQRCMYYFTFVLLTVTICFLFLNLGLKPTYLSLPDYQGKWNRNSVHCTGCHQRGEPKQNREFVCLFRAKDFKVKNLYLKPGGVWYLKQCIVIGPPFTCRDKSKKALQYTPSLQVFSFVCELCTIRANAGQELQLYNEIPRKLLALEHMGMIDTFNRWSCNNVSTYRHAIRNLILFEADFGLKALHPTIDPTTI